MEERQFKISLVLIFELCDHWQCSVLLLLKIKRCCKSDKCLNKKYWTKSIRYLYVDLIKIFLLYLFTKEKHGNTVLRWRILNGRVFFLLLQKCRRSKYSKDFHRIIPTNTYLFKIDYVKSRKCGISKHVMRPLNTYFINVHKLRNYTMICMLP